MASEINPHRIDMASMAAIQWKFWQAALKGVQLPINPNFVPWGFYKMITRDRTEMPVAIWESDGVKYYRVSTSAPVAIGTAADESAWAHSTFQYIRDKPLRKADYHAWVDQGVAPPLSGAAAVVAASKVAPTPVEAAAAPAPVVNPPEPTLVEKVSPVVNAPVAAAEIGHNSGATPPVEPQDIAGKIAVVMAATSKITAISSQEDANASITLTNRLTELVKEANDQREAEKAPHLAAGQAVDARWNAPIIRPAQAEAKRHSGLRGAFATAETKRRREEADAAAAAAAMSQTAGNSEPATVTAPEPVTFQAVGGGRKRTAKMIKCARIVDQDALYEHCKGFQSVRDFFKQMADKVYYSGMEMPGCEADERVNG